MPPGQEPHGFRDTVPSEQNARRAHPARASGIVSVDVRLGAQPPLHYGRAERPDDVRLRPPCSTTEMTAMHPYTRRRAIVEHVNEHGLVSLHDLATLVGASEATIRR
ncbi:DeoR family transcriptional regulator, partial [Luteimicrobium sp. NPDC057192]|uniref:DeoR family transcriptional regulator n=1 Tax=Luteimicrobium sp. NPDC057192 TaxID=3346042 RepID=UPI003643426A